MCLQDVNGKFKINVSDDEVLKTWFKLSRVKLSGNDLRGNKNSFKLAGGSSYQGLELEFFQRKLILVRG